MPNDTIEDVTLRGVGTMDYIEPTKAHASPERLISPLALFVPWRTYSFAIVVLLAFVGTFFNLFHVSSFIKDTVLRKVSNVYAWCAGVSDLVAVFVTLILSFFVLVTNETGQPGEITKCNYAKIIVTASNTATMLFNLVTAVDKYSRLRQIQHRRYKIFNTAWTLILIMTVYVVSISDAYIGDWYKLDYDYCERKYIGNTLYRAITFMFFYVIPCFLTYHLLISTYCHIRVQARHHLYKRSTIFDLDRKEILLAIKMHSMFVLFWIPYIVVMYKEQVSDPVFYNLAWLGFARAVFGGLLCTMVSDTYRRATSRTINYACFKRISRNRQRSMAGGRGLNSEVRMHLMQQAFSPQRVALIP